MCSEVLIRRGDGGWRGVLAAILVQVIEALPHLHVLVVAGAGLAVEMDARGRVRKPVSLVVVSVDVEEDRVPRVLLVAAVARAIRFLFVCAPQL